MRLAGSRFGIPRFGIPRRGVSRLMDSRLGNRLHAGPGFLRARLVGSKGAGLTPLGSRRGAFHFFASLPFLARSCGDPLGTAEELADLSEELRLAEHLPAAVFDSRSPAQHPGLNEQHDIRLLRALPNRPASRRKVRRPIPSRHSAHRPPRRSRPPGRCGNRERCPESRPASDCCYPKPSGQSTSNRG